MLLGVTLVANGLELGYPFEPCITNLSKCCDAVYVSTDSRNKDSTLYVLRRLSKELGNVSIVESEWDWSINNGADLAKRINICLEKGVREGFKEVLYVQADEIVDFSEISSLRKVLGITKCNVVLERTYFWKNLSTINRTWTLPMCRLCPLTSKVRVVGDGMFIEADPSFQALAIPPDIARIYHYSRVGSTTAIAKRLNNLDSLFHEREEYLDLKDYEFGKNNNFESGANNPLLDLYFGSHPDGVHDFYEGQKNKT